MKYNKIDVSVLKGSSYLLCLKVLSLVMREVQGVSRYEGFHSPMTGGGPSAYTTNRENKQELLTRGKEISECLKYELVEDSFLGLNPEEILGVCMKIASLEEDIKDYIRAANLFCYKSVDGAEIVISGNLTPEQGDQLSRFFPMFNYSFI